MKQLVETVVFMQGDDADEALHILYPEWVEGQVNIGEYTAASLKAALDHLKQWDYGEPTDLGTHELSRGPEWEETPDYVMCWDWGYRWIALERKVKNEVTL